MTLIATTLHWLLKAFVASFTAAFLSAYAYHQNAAFLWFSAFQRRARMSRCEGEQAWKAPEMRFEDKTRSGYSLRWSWLLSTRFPQLSTQGEICKAKVRVVLRWYCLKAHPCCSRQSPVQINCTNTAVSSKGGWECTFIFYSNGSPLLFPFQRLNYIWITLVYSVQETGDLKKGFW